jgi:hypothetical protein
MRCGGWLMPQAARIVWRGAETRGGVGAGVSLLAGVSPGRLACPMGLGVSEDRPWDDCA